MFIDIDYSKKKHKVKIQLAKPNKQIISVISEKYNVSLSSKLGNINELNFSIPHMITENFNLIQNPHVDLIKEKMILKVTLGSQVEWFIVDGIAEDGSDTDVFNVTAYSLGFELTHKRLGSYESESVGLEELIGDLLLDTAWTIGSIDDKFKLPKTRSFSISSSNSLDAILEASDTFGAIVFWDTVNRKVSFKDITSIGKYKGLSVDYGRLLKSLSRSRTTDEMTTRLYIYGSEGISIQGVNATGQAYIEDFSYFMYPFKRDENKVVLESSFFMSDELCQSLLDHREIINNKAPDIKTLIDLSAVKQGEIITEESKHTTLLGEMDVIIAKLDTAKATENQALIDSLNVEKTAKQTEIDAQQVIVDNKNTEYADYQDELTVLRNSILTESHFTSELLNELSFYIIEKEWSDDRYIDAQELYDDGLEMFIEMRQPKVVISIDIENLFEIIEEQSNWSKLVLGDLIKVHYPQMNLEYMARIIQIDHDIEGGNIQLTIANTSKTGDEMEQLKALLSSSQSASTIIQNNKHKLDKITNIEGELTKLINDEWDANKAQITAGVNNQIEIGNRGIIIRNPDIPNEIIIIQSGIIALSRDSGDTWKTAIKPTGIVAERLIGKVILGTSLIIEDADGIMRFSGRLQEIFDNNGVAKVQLGEYETGKYGMKIDGGSLEIINGLDSSNLSQSVNDELDNTQLKVDLKMTAPLPTSISLNANGITATTTGNVNKFARLDYRGLYIQGGAVDIRTSATTNRGIILDGVGLRAYDDTGVLIFNIDDDGNATFSGIVTASTINGSLINGSLINLGGTGNNGKLQVYDSTNADDPVVTLDGDNRGFDYLNVGYLEAPNKVEYADYLDDEFILHVATVSGGSTGVSGTPSDENDGKSWSSPLYSITKALSLIPKHFNGKAIIKLASGQTFRENIDINGYSGSGIIEFKNNTTRSTLIGSIDIWGNTTQTEIYNLTLNSTISYAGIMSKSASVFLSAVHINGATGNTTFGINANRGADFEINDCVFNNCESAIRASYGGRVFAHDCSGTVSNVAFNAYGGGVISGGGTAPKGAVANTSVSLGGQVTGTWNFPTPPAPEDPPPPPPPTPTVTTVKTTWTSNSGSGTYQSLYGNGWNTSSYQNSVTQGQWSSATGQLEGIWTFGTGTTSVVAGKTIQRIRVYLTRLSSGGNSASTTITIRPHTYTSRPTGDPSYLGYSTTAGFKWGEGKWVTLPSSFHTAFSSGGARGIGVWANSTSSSYYSKMSMTAKIEITYDT